MRSSSRSASFSRRAIWLRSSPVSSRPAAPSRIPRLRKMVVARCSYRETVIQNLENCGLSRGIGKRKKHVADLAMRTADRESARSGHVTAGDQWPNHSRQSLTGWNDSLQAEVFAGSFQPAFERPSVEIHGRHGQGQL